MRNISKFSKILVMLLITLICMSTIVVAGLESSQYDSQLATAAQNATLGKNNEYFTFDAKSLINKQIHAADAYEISNVNPFDRVAEYCIDNRTWIGGASDYKVLNIIDITPEGKVISYKKNGKNIETFDKTTVNLLKQMSYIAIESIEANEGVIDETDCWKQAMQISVREGMGVLKEQLKLNKGFDVPMATASNSKLDTAKTNSKNKSYTGRFIFLYGSGKQNQIIFGAKEGQNLGSLKIVKNGEDKKLSGVGFILQNADTNEYVMKDYSNKVADYTTNRNNAKEFTTNGSGEINVKGLKAGKYNLYETKNPHDGYVVNPSEVISAVVVKSGSNTAQVINRKVLVKLSGKVWIDKEDAKDSRKNALYKDNNNDTRDELLDGVTVRLKDKTTGNEVKSVKTANGGTYLFTDVYISQLSNYYIEFEYDGLIYTNVEKHLDKANGSKAVEGDRTSFNDKFSIVEGNTQNTGITKDSRGNKQYDLSYNVDTASHKSSFINTGNYIITADTKSAGYQLNINSADYNKANNTIENINLGLYEREKPDISILKDLYNVKLTINGYEHVYQYAQRFVNQGEYGDGFNVGVKFAEKYGNMTYTRPIYKADYEYINEQDKSKELKVYVTYQIAMRNKSDNLIAQINSLVDYYDSKYILSNVGTGVDENGNIVGNIGHQESDYNNEYRKSIINNYTRINPQSESSIYVQFELNREAVLNILNDKANLNNVVEINSYSIIKDNMPYAGIDINSNPGNAIPGNIGTYEDDTDSSPALKLEVAEAREIAGKVFLDSTSGELKTGKIRQGSGAFEDGELGIAGVQVILKETSGSGKEYIATTNENGDYAISGFIPGDYTVTYIWGDKTYTVQKYKGTIYDSSRNQNKDWYKQDVDKRLSDALDNWELRQSIDNELKEITHSLVTTIEKMNSTTPLMGIGVEYETTTTASAGDRYTYQIRNIDFGIVERPRQSLQVTKQVETIKVTLTSGQVIVDMKRNDKGEFEGQMNHITYQKPLDNSNGSIWLQLDTELMQGAVVEVGYSIKVTNNSELDYISENFYKYGKVEGEKITLTPSSIVDYLDKDWAFDAEKHKDIWTIKSLEELKDIVAEKVYNKESKEIKNRLILYTEAFKNEKLEPGQSKAITLGVSKILTASDEIVLDNEVEITKVSKNGGGNIDTTPGNYVPGTGHQEADDSMAETVMVTPPTGIGQALVIVGIIGIIVLTVLGLGVLLIKKKVI